MGFLACGGAQIKCSFGTAPSILNVTPENKVSSNAPMVSITDNIAYKNITPFVMCTSMANPAVASATSAAFGVLTPQPCTPVITGPWAPPSQKVFIGSAPAATAESMLMCAYAGVITLTSAGQTTIVAG